MLAVGCERPEVLGAPVLVGKDLHRVPFQVLEAASDAVRARSAAAGATV